MGRLAEESEAGRPWKTKTDEVKEPINNQQSDILLTLISKSFLNAFSYQELLLHPEESHGDREAEMHDAGKLLEDSMYLCFLFSFQGLLQ